MAFHQKLILMVIIFLSPAIWAKDTLNEAPLRVALIAPAAEVGFWKDSYRFAYEVARDLNIELVFYPATNHDNAYSQLRKAIKDIPNLKYAIITQYFHMGGRMLSLAEKNDVSTIIFNSTFNEVHAPIVGSPREKFPHWLGHIYPDDLLAGAVLAEMLAEQLNENKNQENRINTKSIIGLIGSQNTQPGLLRKAGLLKVVSEKNDLNLLRAIHSEWRKENATNSIGNLLKQYPEVDIIWAAAESLSDGSILAVNKFGLLAGQDVLIGTIGWSGNTINNIEASKLSVALGGHVFQAGWALLLLHDYHHGKDFIHDTGAEIKLPMFAITKDNVQELKDALLNLSWRAVDFKKFSKVYNLKLKSYNFSIDNALKSYKYSQQNPQAENVRKLSVNPDDGDGDGVLDKYDQCQDSIPYSNVHHNGCRINPEMKDFKIYGDENLSRITNPYNPTKAWNWEATVDFCDSKENVVGEVICWRSNEKSWFGAGVMAKYPIDLSNFGGNGAVLEFIIDVPLSLRFRIGIQDENQNQSWVLFNRDRKTFGLSRKNGWQKVSIPISEFLKEPLDMNAITYMFSISNISDAKKSSVDPFDIKVKSIQMRGAKVFDEDKDGINDTNDDCSNSKGEVDGGGCDEFQREALWNNN